MSTRSNIAVMGADGSVTYIYCHFDGYPQHHVPLLTGNYATEEQARALVAPGDMSSLGRNVGAKHDFHSRDSGHCTYYGRDRGETGTEARVAPSLDAFMSADLQGYQYLFRDGAWLGRSRYVRHGAWLPAQEFLAAAQENDDS